mgnify:CR=1 FL=1
MDTQRLILLAAFMLVSMSLWQSWQMQINPPPEPPMTQSSGTDLADTKLKSDDIPSAPVQTQTDTGSSAPETKVSALSLSLIHISEPTRLRRKSRMPSSA